MFFSRKRSEGFFFSVLGESEGRQSGPAAAGIAAPSGAKAPHSGTERHRAAQSAAERHRAPQSGTERRAAPIGLTTTNVYSFTPFCGPDPVNQTAWVVSLLPDMPK